MPNRRTAMRSLGLAVAGLLRGVRLATAQGRPAPTDFPSLDLLDPYVATVVGAAGPVNPDLPELGAYAKLERFHLPILADRAIPELFWYYRSGLRIELASQVGPAPLAFVIAGTGGSTSSVTAQLLARVLLKGGMHVAIISSPTFAEFLVSSSATCVPGRPQDDARDLYRVMRLARIRIERRIKVSGWRLAGFSLGAMNAAFVAALDRKERVFGFDKVLLVNPPLDLWSSLALLDRLLDERVERDPGAVQSFIDEVFRALAAVYAERPGTELTGEDLYRTLARLKNREALLQLLVGLVFRVSASSLAFTSDVMIHAGYLVARDARPGITSSLTNVFEASLDLSFKTYAEEVVIPFFLGRDPALTKERLLGEARLEQLRDFLHDNPAVAMVTNRDDIILAPGELARLQAIFGRRATILPNGGHGGSIGRGDFTETALNFMSA